MLILIIFNHFYCYFDLIIFYFIYYLNFIIFIPFISIIEIINNIKLNLNILIILLLNNRNVLYHYNS